MKKYLFLFCLPFLFVPVKMFANCHANFSVSINSYNPPQVSFTNYSSDSLGTITSYLWSFGDGQTDVVPNPNHTYAANGNYTVCLIIGTSTGCNDTLCYYLNMFPPPPSVVATLFPDSNAAIPCMAPASINFSFRGNFVSFSPPDSALFHIYFGDGTDSIFYNVISQSTITGYFNHIYWNSGTFNPQIVITAPGNVADSFMAPQVFIASSCGNISGIVYQDNNNNCTYDAGDVLVINSPVYLTSNFNFVSSTTTDHLGFYSFNVPAGQTYQINVPSNYGFQSHQTVGCPNSGTYVVSAVPSTGNDFGLNCLPAFDLQSFISTSCLRPGFIGHANISAINARCNTPSGQIQVIFPPDLTPLPDSVNSYNISGNTVTFQINSPDLYWWRNIPVLVSSSALVGATECIDINATPVLGDADPTNNSVTYCAQLAGSYDPNLKEVDPVGQGVQGLIAPGKDLTYTINFQNTGTASAINIFILDTIDSDLDPSTIRIIGASHPMTWAILPGNILRFDFNNILLPDSNSNELYSHGSVLFRISQKLNLPQYTLISNRASIFFDFNTPISTNSTTNTIDYTLTVQSTEMNGNLFSISPNPASERCTLNFNSTTEKVIDVFDYSGRLIFSKKIYGDIYQLDLSKYENGSYFIHMTDNYRNSVFKNIIIQRKD